MANQRLSVPGHVVIVTDYGNVLVTPKTYKRYHDVHFRKYAPKKSLTMIDEELTKTACRLAAHEAIMGRILEKI